ncbi:MAG: hypothetical protein EBV21_07595, partial [Betaproteobacteria bacterium]|nr:hypothetical protein [Betaproteobacteria bacterium]
MLSLIGTLEGMVLNKQVRDKNQDGWREMPVESCDILILDSPLQASTQERDRDLAWLGQCVTRHPMLGVLWLTHDIDPAFLL